MTGPCAMPGLFGRCPPHVRIVEVGPRDGLQNEARRVPAAAKIAFVNALSAAGHSHIEVTAFVSPRKVPQMADAEEVFRGIARREGVTYTALVPNDEGLRRALEAGARSIAVFTSPSSTPTRRVALPRRRKPPTVSTRVTPYRRSVSFSVTRPTILSSRFASHIFISRRPALGFGPAISRHRHRFVRPLVSGV